MIVQSKPTGFAGRWSSIREVELYSTADGDEPVADFLNSLPPKHQAPPLTASLTLPKKKFFNYLPRPTIARCSWI